MVPEASIRIHRHPVAHGLHQRDVVTRIGVGPAVSWFSSDAAHQFHCRDHFVWSVHQRADHLAREPAVVDLDLGSECARGSDSVRDYFRHRRGRCRDEPHFVPATKVVLDEFDASGPQARGYEAVVDLDREVGEFLLTVSTNQVQCALAHRVHVPPIFAHRDETGLMPGELDYISKPHHAKMTCTPPEMIDARPAQQSVVEVEERDDGPRCRVLIADRAIWHGGVSVEHLANSRHLLASN